MKGLTGFWLASLSAAALALLLSVTLPWVLAESEGAHGLRLPGVQLEHILGACALVLLANLVGMWLGGFKFVFFTLYPGRRVASRKGREHDPS